MVQAEGNQCTFQEDEHPDTNGTSAFDKSLESHHAHLHFGPDECREQCNRQHSKEADHKDKGGTVERAQPIGELRIEETVMQINDDAGNQQCAHHAHVKRLDVGNHRKAACAADLCREVYAKSSAPLGEHCAQKVMEGQVEHQCFHAAAGILFFRHADGKRDCEQQRQLVENGPAALEDNVPNLIEQAVRTCKIPHDSFGCKQCSYTDHDACECKQQDGSKHCSAEFLNLLHHNVLVTLSNSLNFVSFYNRPCFLLTGYQVVDGITRDRRLLGRRGRS